MALALPDPPPALDGPPRAFYDTLREMLAVVRPGRLDVAGSVVRFGEDRVEIGLAHADRDAWRIGATIGRHDAMVVTDATHEHFSPAASDEMVDFIAELLRGEIEVETTYRGPTPIEVRHFNRGPGGERVLLGHTGLLVPARLFLWRELRAETERVSWR
ncbi:MAG: hypothetical protein ACXW08_18140 [Solirubrobacteraceae bacterium]